MYGNPNRQIGALLFAGLVALLASVPAVQAQDASRIAQLQALDEAQSHAMVLRAQGDEAKAQAELDKAQSQIGSPGVQGATTPEDVEQKLPAVANVFGGQKLIAIFLYPNGSTDRGSVGAHIAGGFTVKSVTLYNTELVDARGHVYNLSSSTTPIHEEPAPQTGQVINQPTLPGFIPPPASSGSNVTTN